MSLRSKIVLILSVVVLLYALADHLTQRILVAPSFSELEREEAQKDLQRVVDAIGREVRHLDQRCLDWSAWDDTYRFAQIRDEAYVATNLERTAFADDHIDMLFICQPGGAIVWAEVHAPGEEKQVALRDFPRQALSRSHPLLAENTRPGREEPELGRASGVWMTERGPMLVAARPILTSERKGPARGTLIMGRFLGASLIGEIAAQTSVSFDVWPLGDPALPERERSRLDEITSAPTAVLAERDDATLDAYTTLANVQAAPSLLVRANVQRAISARGATSIRYALISTVAAGLLLLLVLLGVLQKTVLRPIARLTDHAVDIGAREDPSVKLDLRRSDEIGILAREFDDMIEKLARSRAAVVEVARAAGKSEIATGILHNVGNVLNSVNVSANLVADRVRNSKLVKLERLARVAEEHAQDLGAFIAQDPKGKHFGPYLSELAKLMSTDQETIAREVRSLSEGIEHIRELVDSQQGFVARAGLREPTSIAEQVETALRFSEQALAGASAIEVVRRFEELPPVPLDKHKLLEILVNLIKNARQSMQRARCPAPRLVASIARAGAERVRIEIEDNGVGIAPDSLAKIFSHGYTTHAEGHGFGLHGAANSATEMGGKLTVRSDGPGRGAVFTLELPIPPPTA